MEIPRMFFSVYLELPYLLSLQLNILQYKFQSSNFNSQVVLLLSFLAHDHRDQKKLHFLALL